MSAAYAQQHIRFGLGSLDLRRAPDLVDALNALRLVNVVRDPDGAWTSRPGQTSLATTSLTNAHSITRADNPMGGQSKLFVGADTALKSGTTGALTSVDTGYSGNPLSLVPWQDRLSGQGWLIVGDSSRVKKIRVSDNLVLPIGLAAPAAAATLSLDTANEVSIEAFESGFTARAGTGSAPTVTYPAGKDGNAMQIVTATAGSSAYYNFADKAITVDLSTFGGGLDATDDDYMHLWLRMDNPLTIQEIRVYLITTAFTGGTLPGTSTTVNTKAYMKAFRPSDVTAMVGTTATAQAATQVAVGRRIFDSALKNPPTQDGVQLTDADTEATQFKDEPVNAGSRQARPGVAAWTEFASVGIPLRRGDFQAIGDNPDWSDIRGICVYVSVATATAATMLIDDFYLLGGAGPDTGEPGAVKYDYVYTNYDPRTGAEGNASPTMAEANWIDALRTGIVVDPAAHSDSAIRQRIYRRGGSLGDAWRFVGVNSTNGGTFTDELSDLAIAAADEVPDDHFAAVPSVNSAGTSVLGQATPYWWGPAQGIVFTAGDSNRPGTVYYCKPDAVDHWGANDYVNASSPTEAVLGGFVLSDQAFAWTNKALYALNINLSDSTVVTSSKTSCTRGLAAPWAFTVANNACFFVASDGIYATDGGGVTDLTDGFVRPLFEGVSRNGLLPVDWTASTPLRLSVWQNELWFSYQDTGGTKRHLVYHLIDQVWRAVLFDVPCSATYADTKVGVNRFLLGSATTGVVFTHDGTSDDGAEISCALRTGTLNQGYPKAEKLYSDFTIDADRDGTTITVTPYLDNETDAETALTINTGSGRQQYLYAFDEVQRAPNLALDFAWASDTDAPKLYAAILTYAVEPPTVLRWSSLPTDHGIPGWQIPSAAFLTLRSDGVVTLAVTAISQTGATSVQMHNISATAAFAKEKRWIPLTASKGVLYTYTLSSDDPFIFYAEESHVVVQPWGSQAPQLARVFIPAHDTSHAQSVYTPGAALAAGG